MKKIIFFSFLSFIFLLSFAQSGPAGIGNSSNIEIWLDASTLGLSNGDSITTWTDVSGNSNNASLASGFIKPTFITNQLNGNPVVDFSGNDVLEFSSHITDEEVTIFSIHSKDVGAPNTVPFAIENHNLFDNISNVSIAIYVNPIQTNIRLTKPSGSFSVFALSSDPGVSGVNVTMSDGSNLLSVNRNSGLSCPTSSIGARNLTGTGFGSGYNRPFFGRYAEFLVYNERLNTAKKNIVASNLAAKYNLTGIKPLYSFKTTYNNDVIGIGQESDGNHTTADNGTEIVISNPSNLDDGEYLLIGHDDGGFGSSSSVPNGVVERIEQIWRADETGNVGTVSIDFDYTSTPFANPNNMVLLFDNDGDFSNGGTFSVAPTQVNVIPLTAEFDFVDVPDGAYFTFAESFTDVTSVQDGQWDQTSTWDCACIPTNLLNVTVEHDVTIDSPSECDDLVIAGPGNLTFAASDSLRINGDFSITGSFDAGTGRVVCNDQIFEQVFNNSSGVRVDFYDFRVNNVDGTRLATGEWGFESKLQVVAGGLNVDGANPNPAVLISQGIGGSMCQILPSMDGAFIGEFIVERFISPRAANFANLSSPISSATIGDLDDDVFLSGVGGANGNATTNNGIFQSVFSYDAANSKHDTILSIGTPMENGRGYEVYLASTLTTFNGATINYEGTPNDGDINGPDLEQGWNLMGNPYHCFINSTDLFRAGLAGTWYIYNSSSGSYSGFAFGGGIPIAAGQGFWLDKSTAGSLAYTFQESYKITNLNGIAFLREKPKPELRLNVSQIGSVYNQDFVTRFNPQAISGHDAFDGRHLPSPHKEVPALTRKIEASNTRLMMNVVDDYSFTHRIPMEFYAGVDGEYEIKSEDVSSVYDKYNCVYLADKENNELIDLSVDNVYAFSSKEGKFDRFELILSNSYEECEKTTSTEVNQELGEDLKLRNAFGDWFLDYVFTNDREERVEISLYNTAGQLVQNIQSYSLRGSGSLPLRFDELNGVYIIRIQSSNEFLNQTIHL